MLIRRNTVDNFLLSMYARPSFNLYSYAEVWLFHANSRFHATSVVKIRNKNQEFQLLHMHELIMAGHLVGFSGDVSVDLHSGFLLNI